MACRANDRGVCTASHQDLAESTGSSISAVRRSLDCFENHHRLIAGERAPHNRPKSYRLLFLCQQVPEVPLFKLSTPPVQIEHPSAQNDQAPLSKLNTPPVQIEHPSNQESATYEPATKEDARVDLESTTLTTSIDRVQNLPKRVDAEELARRLEQAHPRTANPEALEIGRRMLHEYARRYRRGGAEPPDDRIVAQFLAIAPLERLDREVMAVLWRKRIPAGTNYGWFLTLAANWIHGMKAQDWAAALERRHRKPPQSARTQDFGFTQDFQEQMRAAAAGKGMR